MKDENYTLKKIFPLLDAFFYTKHFIKAFDIDNKGRCYLFSTDCGIIRYIDIKENIFLLDGFKYKFMIVVSMKSANRFEYVIYDYEYGKCYSLDSFINTEKYSTIIESKWSDDETFIKLMNDATHFVLVRKEDKFNIKNSKYNYNILNDYNNTIQNYILKTEKFHNSIIFKTSLLEEIMQNDDCLRLIEFFPNVNQYNLYYNLLNYSIIFDAKKIFNYLIENGCDVNLCSLNLGASPLQTAIDGEKKFFISRLLEKGANINSKDIYGQNALYTAIWTRNNEIFDIIYSLENLEIRMNEFPNTSRLNNITDGSFQNPIQVACISGNFYALQVLAQKYDINVFDDNSFHPLYYALSAFKNSPSDRLKEYYKIIEFLLKNGADITFEDVYPIYYHISGRERIIHKKNILSLIKKINDDKLNALIAKYCPKKNQDFLRNSINLFCKLDYDDTVDDFEIFKFILIILFAELKLDFFNDYVSIKMYCDKKLVCHAIEKKDDIHTLRSLFDEIRSRLNDNDIIQFLENSIPIWTEMLLHKTSNYDKVRGRIIWFKGFAKLGFDDYHHFIDFYKKCIAYIVFFEKQLDKKDISNNNL